MMSAGRVDTVRELRKQSNRIDEQARARSLGQSSIGEDGLRIYDKGSLDVEGGGNVNVRDGGKVIAFDGGQVLTLHPNGKASTWAGSFNDDGEPGYGFIVQRPDATDIFNATDRTSGSQVRIGSLPNPVYHFTVYSQHAGLFGDFSVSLISSGVFGVLVEARGGPVKLDSDTDDVRIVPHGATTVNGANCNLDPATGRVLRSSSSRRYKAHIQPLELDADTVLAMEPVTFTAANEEDSSRHVGLIAEQLDECGMGQFVTYDDEGPEAISYDRLTVALLAVAKNQQTRLESQQQQIDALSARLDALENTRDS
jgi:hypothetical protein